MRDSRARATGVAITDPNLFAVGAQKEKHVHQAIHDK